MLVKRKRAFITGVTGQDGSYLSEYLLMLGYEVHGLIRPTSSMNRWRIDHISKRYEQEKNGRFHLHYGDLYDGTSLTAIIAEVKPHEIYHLGGQSHVKVSFEIPVGTSEVVATGTLKLLEAIRAICPESRFYQASSSEMFGNSPPPQSESSLLDPRSPYAIAKVMAHHTVRNYREAFGMFLVNGILFNHESPRRGDNFVTRKIAHGAVSISLGRQSKLYLGNLDAIRDWGYAPDYIRAMHLMLQNQSPTDYVIGTSKSFSVRDFLEFSFGYLGMDWRDHVIQDSKFLRPTEVDLLCADSSKATAEIGWLATVECSELAQIMINAELARSKTSEQMADPWIFSE